MWQRMFGRLGQIPIADPVEKRNAVFLQILMLLMGCAVPLNWLYLKLATGFAHAPGLALDRALSFVVAAVAWACFLLLRRGHFRAAIQWFLLAEVVTQLISYGATGLRMQMSDPTTSILIVVLAGMMLGRRTLWLMFGLLLAMFAVGAATDVVRTIEHGEHWWRAVSYTPSVVLRYFIIIVVIDRCLAALRESLDESISQGRALSEANARLRHEMGERERAQEQLIHAQKMEAVGRLAGGIAHDFNHVLSVVLGYAGQRQRLADAGNAALLRAMDGIETAARRGAAICRKLLGFSRQDVAHPDLFDAGQALAELEPMLRQLFDASPVDVVLDPADAGTPIRFDRGQFDLMVLNIAANARDAMPAGGCFSMRAARLPDGGVEIALKDDGYGMTSQVSRHIFEPFYTTKSAENGTGLGLAIVHELIGQAGGSIAVESAPERGSTFRIRLPLAMASDTLTGRAA
ncbi:sensor histidine kinase [Rhodanobacter sp. Col0626]|uniref:sensor histidine kinase n=1 Tax=Rhodanobacter sp. Col0626 TaxID=3415679 RepID=UPI003CF27D35